MGTKPGVKLDQGKNLVGLCFKDFARALYQVSKVTTYGATKHTPGGWLTVPDGHARYTDAMLRHFLAECAGRDGSTSRDEESGLYHAAQVAWNALARLDLMLRAVEIHDNERKAGVTITLTKWRAAEFHAPKGKRRGRRA